MATISPKLDLVRSVDALKINPLTRKPLGQGQHIYAYCNIRTNQVIYSLTQVLRSQRNLKQLPEAGNNTKPPKLRKDLWRPLWTLTLPHGFQGEAQGLEAWKRLNALRYMHELYWTPPKELSRNRTKEEMEELQERIEDRGGSKKENVYDLIKRQKKKLRLKNVMDQKANSIADLAAVLVEQEAVSENGAETYTEEEVRRMVNLNQRAERGALEVIEARIAGLNEHIKELVRTTPVDKETADSITIRTLRAQRYRTRRALKDAHKAKEEMEHALLMVSYVEPAIANPELESGDGKSASETDQASSKTAAIESLSPKSKPLEISSIPKPTFNMEGVKVTWQNIMDAEFAPVWPAAVEHEWMGITRHSAPKPEAEPRMTAQEYYEGKTRLRLGEDEGEVENVREGVVKRVAGSIIKQLIGSRPKSANKPSPVAAVEQKRVKEHLKEAT